MIVPIFIICRDRFTVLKKSIESYRKLGDSIRLIIHDNGSTYKPLLDYYKELEAEGVEIYYSNTDGNHNDISDKVADTIKQWYEKHSTVRSEYYIVTDPDIELENPSQKLLYYYINVLQRYPQAVCVSPMLRIDDIPDCFKFKKSMVKSHEVQFWDEKINPRMDMNGVIIQWAMVDTTFGMYRRNFTFKRLNKGIRTHEPYMAKHLDWYQDTANLTEEEQYYVDHASAVSTLSVYNKQGTM